MQDRTGEQLSLLSYTGVPYKRCCICANPACSEESTAIPVELVAHVWGLLLCSYLFQEGQRLVDVGRFSGNGALRACFGRTLRPRQVHHVQL